MAVLPGIFASQISGHLGGLPSSLKYLTPNPIGNASIYWAAIGNSGIFSGYGNIINSTASGSVQVDAQTSDPTNVNGWTIKQATTTAPFGAFINAQNPVWTGSYWVGTSSVSGQIFYSSDGSTWNTYATGSGEVFNSIVWTGSQIVGIGSNYGGNWYINSANPVGTWIYSGISAPSGNNYFGIYNNGYILMATSTNVYRSSGSTSAWSSVLTVSGTTCIAGNGSSTVVVVNGTSSVYVSTNSGASFTQYSGALTGGSTNNSGYVVSYDSTNGYWFIGGLYGYGWYATSPSGTWTCVEVPIYRTWNTSTIGAAFYNGKGMLGHTGTYATTINGGQSWTRQTASLGDPIHPPQSIVYGNNIWVILKNQGSVGKTGSSYLNSYISYSTDGTTWNLAATTFSGYAPASGPYYINGKFWIADDGNQKFWYSTDGSNWTLVTPTNSGTYGSTNLAAGDSLGNLVTFGNYSATIGYSNNNFSNITWFNPGSGTNQYLCVANGNNLFVIGDSNGKIYTSSSGASGTWTTRSSGVSTNILDIAYSSKAGKFVAVTGATTIIYSTNGISWTTATPLSSSPQAIYGDSNGFVLVDNLFNAYTSPDGITWTKITTNGLTNQPTSLKDGVNFGYAPRSIASNNGKNYKIVFDNQLITN